MKLSRFYARVIGLYLVIMTVGMFLKPQPLEQFISQKNSSEMIVLGIVTLIFGLLMVCSHQKFKGWPFLITILGYWATIKGILIIFYPTLTLKMSHILLQENNLMVGLGVDFIVGILLLFLGLKKTKKA